MVRLMGPGIEFEWDAAKAATNLRKHGVSFEEAVTVFSDAFSLTIADPVEPENRLVTVGWSHRRRTLVVVHSDRGTAIRLISARVATRKERKVHEEGRARRKRS